MKKFTVVTVVAVLMLSSFAVGAKKRGQKARQYKKYNRDLVTRLTSGDVAGVKKVAEEYVTKNPDDLEYRFILTICHAQSGDIPAAMAMAEESVAKGLPLERYLAGPRDLLGPLTSSSEFKGLAAGKTGELIHGPLVGSVTDRGAGFWIRTYNEVPVEVSVFRDGETEPVATAKSRTEKGEDYTSVVSVTGLRPSTEYQYSLVLNGKQQSERYTFKTMPACEKPARFVIAFGGGAGYTPWKERMWNTVKSHEPVALMLLGDCVYIDTPKVQNTQKYCYYRRQSRPEFRALTPSTSVSAIWDDHDFVTNDAEGGPEIDSPDWKIPVWKTFRNNWNNPAYGGGEKQPGCWFKQSIADVDFFFLDGRYYRHREGKTMLGPVQKKWLFEQLRNSKAVFKVICSNVPISKGVKPGSRDPWDGFPEEREEIYKFLSDNKTDGVFVIAADRHRSDAWKNERPSAYPIYEFQSSRLTNVHTHGIIKGCLFGYNELCSFGRLTFDTTKPDPEVTYDVINIDNELVESLTLKKSQLTSE